MITLLIFYFHVITFLFRVARQAHVVVQSRSPPCASYEIWHTHLGHATSNIISLLKQIGCLSFTSLLPKPTLCSSCQLAKQHRVPFMNNDKCALHVLDLAHCDLWRRTPNLSTDGFCYYAIFIDEFSRFTWFYHLKRKSDFFETLKVFLTFVHTQFSTKLKVFQSDGGTGFVNSHVK